MVEAHFAVYYRRAAQLAEAMKLCREDVASYAYAAALLAVHCAISYNDAVLIGLGSSRPRGDNHLDAVKELKKACTKAKVEAQGITHLQKLLSAKSDVSYGEKRIDDEKVLTLCNTAERFQSWAERILQNRKGKLSS